MNLPWEPFALGEGPDACLLLHGFSGSPWEVRPLGEALAAAGFRAVAPLLAGHGRGPEGLLAADRHDLLAAARASLRELAGARHVFVAGLSAGALLALELAATLRLKQGDPPLAGLALLAPAVRFRGTSWLFAEVLGRLPLPRQLELDKGPRDLGVPELPPAQGLLPPAGLRPDGSIDRLPLGAARELRLLSQEAFALARRVRTPALILHGALDQTTSPRGARLLAGQLAGHDVEVRLFAQSGHLLPVDREGPAVCAAVAGFFRRRRAAPA